VNETLDDADPGAAHWTPVSPDAAGRRPGPPLPRTIARRSSVAPRRVSTQARATGR
jgi:hypothetical protein